VEKSQLPKRSGCTSSSSEEAGPGAWAQ